MAREHRKAIGRRGKQLRERLELTQREVSDLIPDDEVTSQYISNWERGIHIPNDDHMEAWATALATDPGDIMAGVRDDTSASSAPDPFATGESFEPAATVEGLSSQIESARIELLARIDLARDEQADLQRLLERDEHGEEGTGT